jgi:hypothetical protein
MFGFEPKKILFVVLTVLAIMTWRDWSMREIEHPPGVLVTESPRQNNLENGALITMDEFRMKPRAEFQLRARVLSREDYSWGTESGLSPVDLALGWGVMSDQAVLDRISIEQRSRWYFTQYDFPAPISDQAIVQHSSNMHMVPSKSWIEKELKRVRRGDIVQLRGYLVDVDTDSGWQWRTSLSRSDTGNGACEIFYLEDIVIEARS